MKKVICSIFIFVLLFQNVAYGSGLNLSGNSYILMEEKSGKVLVEKNSHLEMPIASTTKIMTALIAIERGNLDKLVEVSDESINIEGSSIYLKHGELISLRDLLYGLMLRSGNDSAVAIACEVSGSEAEFVNLMNKKAKEIGAYNTNFVNPHGLHNENHYSSAYDLALITREAFKSKDFEEIAKAKSYRSSREENSYFVNKNKTIFEYDGGDGVKIGYTTSSGRCLVSSATKDNMRLIAVSLKAGDWFNDNYKLMDYGFDNYKLYSIYNSHQLITKAKVKDGIKEEVALVADRDFLYPLKDDEKDDIVLSLDLNKDIRTPIEKDKTLGYVSTYLDGKLIRRDNLVAKYRIDKKSFINIILDKMKTINN